MKAIKNPTPYPISVAVGGDVYVIPPGGEIMIPEPETKTTQTPTPELVGMVAYDSGDGVAEGGAEGEGGSEETNSGYRRKSK